MSGFKDLKVWQRSKELAVLIYRLTQKGPFTRDYGFRDQIRRAAVSVPSNNQLPITHGLLPFLYILENK